MNLSLGNCTDAQAFRYFTRPLPRWLRESPTGNLAEALALGMVLVEQQDVPRASDFAAHSLFVPQGVSMPEAEVGLTCLAGELNRYIADAGLVEPVVFLPSGTGATAFFLQRHL